VTRPGQMVQVAIGLVLGVALGPLPSSPSRGTQLPNGIVVRLIVTPTRGFVPLVVRASALVRDPRQELHCPTFGWDWGDGSTSDGELAECDPYEQESPARYAPLPRTHTYWSRGSFQLKLAVRDSSTMRLASRRVEVQ
jgi:hypothetical protein